MLRCIVATVATDMVCPAHVGRAAPPAVQAPTMEVEGIRAVMQPVAAQVAAQVDVVVVDAQ